MIYEKGNTSRLCWSSLEIVCILHSIIAVHELMHDVNNEIITIGRGTSKTVKDIPLERLHGTTGGQDVRRCCCSDGRRRCRRHSFCFVGLIAASGPQFRFCCCWYWRTTFCMATYSIRRVQYQLSTCIQSYLISEYLQAIPCLMMINCCKNLLCFNWIALKLKLPTRILFISFKQN